MTNKKFRDKTIDEIAEDLSAYPWLGLTKEQKDMWRTFIKDKVISNEHVAIVNRKAKFPEKEFISANENYRYKEAQQDMVKAGFKYKIVED